MSQAFTTTAMNIDGREFVLAEIRKGVGCIGNFRYSSALYNTLDIFYVENEPIIKIFDSNTTDPTTDKHLTQISGSEKCSHETTTRLIAAHESLYRYDQDVLRSVHPILDLLRPGLYVIHDSQMFPTDGSGRFFWNAYNNKRKVTGSCLKNAVIGEKNYSPCFLIPTKTVSSYRPERMYSLSKKLSNGAKLGGVAYHVSGMFSALLEGHHAATACLVGEGDFRCMVIEPLVDVVLKRSGGEGLPGKQTIEKERITALSCPYINIPISELSENALELFLTTRKCLKPAYFKSIKPKTSKTLRTLSQRIFPITAYDRARSYANTTLVETASGINEVSDAQLSALLSGEVKYKDDKAQNGAEKYIFHPNFYTTITAVSAFLKVNDFKRFLSFAMDVLKSTELSNVHKFFCDELLCIMHPTIHEYFSSVLEEVKKENENTPDQENAPKRTKGIKEETAIKYMTDWGDYMQKRLDDAAVFKAKQQKSIESQQAIVETRGIATLEMAVKNLDTQQINPII